ncbi:hypothetical protein ACVRWE_07065 [Streptococcus urinalis]|uniref:hypothetical protein n=1 Tax=Streptococcus urinalis TaxID=149016 RepID=UPI000225D2D6|nr:hypothetical protein [Streptococcus urinalis]
MTDALVTKATFFSASKSNSSLGLFSNLSIALLACFCNDFSFFALLRLNFPAEM